MPASVQFMINAEGRRRCVALRTASCLPSFAQLYRSMLAFMTLASTSTIVGRPLVKAGKGAWVGLPTLASYTVAAT